MTLLSIIRTKLNIGKKIQCKKIQCENTFLMHKLLTNQISPEIKETFKLSLKEQCGSARNTLYKYNVSKLPKTNTSTFGDYSLKYQCILTWHY